jgi:hypothetical protein
MNKKLISMVLGGTTLAGLLAAQAYASISICNLTARGFPGSGSTDTVFGSCQHTSSAGRGDSEATFVAQNQGGTKTLSASMTCCIGTTATIVGLDASSNPISGCFGTASPTTPVSFTCNSAARWVGSFQYNN